jgi:ABC-2 type transport system ATP-binding protein
MEFMTPTGHPPPESPDPNSGPLPADRSDAPGALRSAPPPAVDIETLDFTYPGQPDLLFSNLKLKIGAGERFGLFGPNGAGKTTLMNLMTGLLTPTQGSIRILGEPITRRRFSNPANSPRRLFGFIPQELSFYEELSPTQNLAFFGAWTGLDKEQIQKRTKELLDILGLTEVRNRPVAQFSGGMKRRLNLAIGVIHQPRVLFLDEPTVGVDVQSRHAIINYLKELNARGMTLIYTSHQLNEAEDLCENIALIDEGKIIVHDDLERLLSEHRQGGLENLFLTLTGKNYRN